MSSALPHDEPGFVGKVDQEHLAGADLHFLAQLPPLSFVMRFSLFPLLPLGIGERPLHDVTPRGHSQLLVREGWSVLSEAARAIDLFDESPAVQRHGNKR